MVPSESVDLISKCTLPCAGVPYLERTPPEDAAARGAEDELESARAPSGAEPDRASDSEELNELAARCSADMMPRAEGRAGIAASLATPPPPAVAGPVEALAEVPDVKV